MITKSDIIAASERISHYIIETPLIRIPALDEYLGCRAYIKAENMQITGSFKLRGALNRALSLTEEERARGIVCASSGNHGRAIAYAAKMLGTKATVIMPRTAPQIKKDAIRALGADVILCEASERFEVADRVCAQLGATLIPPYNDDYVMAGQGTAGLEIVRQLPDADAVITAVSGGGLIAGVSSAVKAFSPGTKVYGAEPAVLPRYSSSLASGQRVTVPFNPTVADALVSQTPGELCFPVVSRNVDAVFPVSEEYVLKAMKLLLTVGKIFAEPSSCIGMGAVLEGYIKPSTEDKVCFLISGGNAGLEQLKLLENVNI